MHYRITFHVTIAAAFLLLLSYPAAALPPELKDYDPSGQIRFKTPAEADARREKLIRFIWPDGLPKTKPAVTADLGDDVFSGDLKGVDAARTARVDKLDADVGGYDFHSISYLIHPKTPPAQPRLAIVHPGHGGRLPDDIRDTINHLLGKGFHVFFMHMPLVGWNRDNTVRPAADSIITVNHTGSKAHNDLFKKLEPTKLAGGAAFRFFLEPVVQNVNHFTAAHPNHGGILMIGLSGGGWTTHMAAAIDVRIGLSIPVAGSLPLYARAFSSGSWGDTEQFYEPLYREIDSDDADKIPDRAAGVASWLEIYALGGYGRGRRQIQVLNLYDSCCFSGDVYETYDDFLSKTVARLGRGKWGFVSDATHKSHVISAFTITKVLDPAITEPAR